MKIFLDKWRNWIFEDKEKGLIPLDIIDFLIKKYAVNPGGGVSLKRGYFDFNELGKWAKDFESTAAMYLIPSQMLIINTKNAGNFEKLLDVILHEIQHYNQHMRWESDDSYRQKISKGYKLPPGKDLFEINWLQMTQFWNKIYNYDDRPHEKDAFDFAENKFQEAYSLILAREKELKKNKKGVNVKNKNVG